MPRRLERLVTGQPTQDGAGVRLTRILTPDLQRRLDPFLMLDHLSTHARPGELPGFPSHPHRGFETITYMLRGTMHHRDSAGHRGRVSDGGVQWMTAGRGVVHSEMPEPSDGAMEGFQLWLNLPARDKLCPPWYQDFQGGDVPEATIPGELTVRAIAGAVTLPDGQRLRGAVARPASSHPTDPLWLDLHLPAKPTAFELPLPPDHHAFLYVYRGTLRLLEPGGHTATVPCQRMAILAPSGDGVALQTDPTSAEPPRALLIAGRPLNEPVAQHGPFVMNTHDELVRAVHDFQIGRLG